MRGSLGLWLHRKNVQDCCFLVPAWGSYSWLLDPCVKAWRRAWSNMPPVTVVGDRPDRLPADARFLGTFPKEEDWHPALYSDALRDTLEALEEPVVFLIPVDTFPTGPIPNRAMDSLTAYAAREGILRVQPHQHRHSTGLTYHWKFVKWWRGVQIVESSDRKQCSLIAGMSMDAAFWDREEFASLLAPKKTFWEIEAEGTHVMWKTRPDLRSVGVIPPLFWVTDIVQNRRPGTLIHTEELDEESRESVLTAKPQNWRVI